jgi:hypothetical protein
MTILTALLNPGKVLIRHLTFVYYKNFHISRAWQRQKSYVLRRKFSKEKSLGPTG